MLLVLFSKQTRPPTIQEDSVMGSMLETRHRESTSEGLDIRTEHGHIGVVLDFSDEILESLADLVLE